MMEIETISPLDFPEVTQLCRVSNRLTAECEGCGRVLRGGVHLCDIARAGFLCDICCPVHSGRVVPTGEELKAIDANRRRCQKEDLEMERNAPKPVAPPKPAKDPGPTIQQYWVERQSKLIIRTDPSKAPRSGQALSAFRLLEDGMPYLVGLNVLAGRFPNPKMILGGLRTRRAIRWSPA